MVSFWPFSTELYTFEHLGIHAIWRSGESFALDNNALLETVYVLARILQTYRYIESKDIKAWKGEAWLTSRKTNGCQIAFFAMEMLTKAIYRVIPDTAKRTYGPSNTI